MSSVHADTAALRQVGQRLRAVSSAHQEARHPAPDGLPLALRELINRIIETDRQLARDSATAVGATAAHIEQVVGNIADADRFVSS